MQESEHVTEARTVTLDELVGTHTLTGVDMGRMPNQEQYHDFDMADTISFCLDGVTYTAVENPDDGYRSMLSYIFVSDQQLSNTFPGHRVLASLSTERDDMVLVLRDMMTGKEILRVGTENTDDYYPSFVASFQPENLLINQDVDTIDPLPAPVFPLLQDQMDKAFTKWIFSLTPPESEPGIERRLGQVRASFEAGYQSALKDMKK